ncbi:MAG TPA: tail fiber domain-containing protein [Candidatus Deferrimicrobium sp.]|nr:tail fiber domain-containing protein [Candidatus Deferrimicrobium sp.]
MYRRKKFLSTFLYVFLLTVICFVYAPFSVSAKAETPGGTSVADITVSSGGIIWTPRVSYEQLLVTISRPDGSVYSKTFTSGTTPYLDLSNICGGHFCDGSYTYELRFIPFAETKVRGEEQVIDIPSQEPLTQTGHFLVQGGMMVPQGGVENMARPMDVVHADDVIVTGSICVGYDCLTDGTESFGFDTIKLKENNLQIFFDDTSSAVGFPANDWRIITNDSSSGGGNYFSIQDSTNSKVPFKIEANAPTSALYVDDAGRVGIGTSTPVLNLHIVKGDSPSLRLDQDTSYGWTAQVWDISGNESNFFVRDVTGGSKLPFRIQPGTPTNTLTLRADGKVGIGTWAPGYPMELATTGENASFVCNRTDGAQNFISSTTSYGQFGTVSNHPTRILVNSAWKFQLNSDNSLSVASGASCTAGGTWTNASSRALKENIQSLSTEEALQTINNLNPVKYNYKVDKEERHVGFIAEDAPELVATKDKKGMSPMDVVAVLTKVVQEQQKSLQEQQECISQLKTKIAELEKKSK